jgi:hypothetical protein
MNSVLIHSYVITDCHIACYYYYGTRIEQVGPETRGPAEREGPFVRLLQGCELCFQVRIRVIVTFCAIDQIMDSGGLLGMSFCSN